MIPAQAPSSPPSQRATTGSGGPLASADAEGEAGATLGGEGKTGAALGGEAMDAVALTGGEAETEAAPALDVRRAAPGPATEEAEFMGAPTGWTLHRSPAPEQPATTKAREATMADHLA